MEHRVHFDRHAPQRGGLAFDPGFVLASHSREALGQLEAHQRLPRLDGLPQDLGQVLIESQRQKPIAPSSSFGPRLLEIAEEQTQACSRHRHRSEDRLRDPLARQLFPDGGHPPHGSLTGQFQLENRPRPEHALIAGAASPAVAEEIQGIARLAIDADG